MTSSRTGDQLLELLRAAPEAAVLISPFVKVDALRQATAVLSPSCYLTVVTRWRPEEIRAGVSDLEVWDELSPRPLTEMRLCDRLHAQYYRADKEVLIGSANLTGLGMGWRTGANIELLMSARFDAGLASFERMVRANSVPATADAREAMAAAVAELPPPASAPARAGDVGSGSETPWLPRSRYPASLWLLYSGQQDRLTSAAAEDAAADQQGLSIPPALTERAFDRYVAALLTQLPLVQRLDIGARAGRRFGEMRRMLSADPEVVAAGRSPEELLQTLMRWLVHFSPNKYELRVATFSESLRRR